METEKNRTLTRTKQEHTHTERGRATQRLLFPSFLFGCMKMVVTSKDRHPIGQKDDEKALKSKAFSVQAESAPLPHPPVSKGTEITGTGLILL